MAQVRKKAPPRASELAGARKSRLDPTRWPKAASSGNAAVQLQLIGAEHIVVDSTGSDSWCTPPEVFEPCLRMLDRPLFDLDPCSNAKSLVPARKMFTIADDGLAQDWEGESLWLNPPYSSPSRWLERNASCEVRHRFSLVTCDPTRGWFRQIWRATVVLFYSDRIKFMDPTSGGRKSPPFPCVLAYYGPDLGGFARVHEGAGKIFCPADAR